MDSDKLDEWPVTIPKVLKKAGYRTMYITTNGHSSGHYGFLQGVDDSAYENAESAQWAVGQAAQFLQRAAPSRPVFMYVHTIEPHEPYAPKPGTFKLFDRTKGHSSTSSMAPALGVTPPRADIEHLLDLYDGEIRDADAAFASFLDVLRKAGRYEDSVIIVVADHGESFGEHGAFCHGRSLGVTEMHVPLIIRYPGGRYAGRRVKARVSLVDIYPSVIEAVGARPRLSYGLPGRDLAALAAAPTAPPEVPIYAEVSKHANNRLDLVGVIDEEGYKRVFNMSVKGGGPASPTALGLWDTRADPAEQKDLVASLPVRADYEEALMARYLLTQRWWRGAASTGKTAEAPLTAAMREHLKALGYLK
jgi:choline-sulfatase